MDLNRTEKYIADLSKVRSMPQESDSEKSEKKEQARELRMEIMLDTARLLESLTAQLEYNSWATAEDLKKSVSKSAEYLAHPEAVEDYINSLQHTKKRVETVLNLFTDKEPGQQIYSLLKSPDHVQQGEVYLDTSYPLAVTLFVKDPSDFANLNAKEGSIGFHSKKRNYSFISNGHKINVEAPLIVIRDDMDSKEGQRIKKHESAHAHHTNLMSLEESGAAKLIWLRRPIESITVKGLISGYKHGEDHGSKEFKDCVNYALACAKDEILAKLHDDPDSLNERIKTIQTKGSIYDYFKDLGIPANEELYKDIWETYSILLNPAVRMFTKLTNIYKKMSLKSRLSLMRWVFIQIPIQEWEEQLDNSGFLEEAERLASLQAKTEKPTEAGTQKYLEVLTKIRQNQDHSLNPILKSL